MSPAEPLDLRGEVVVGVMHLCMFVSTDGARGAFDEATVPVHVRVRARVRLLALLRCEFGVLGPRVAHVLCVAIRTPTLPGGPSGLLPASGAEELRVVEEHAPEANPTLGFVQQRG